MGKLWQRNYYEHIIRNEQSYQTIFKEPTGELKTAGWREGVHAIDIIFLKYASPSIIIIVQGFCIYA
jgi:hypothetical protein